MNATPLPGSVTNRDGNVCPAARPTDYPLHALCTGCYLPITCADSTADWGHDDTHRGECGRQSGKAGGDPVQRWESPHGRSHLSVGDRVMHRGTKRWGTILEIRPQHDGTAELLVQQDKVVVPRLGQQGHLVGHLPSRLGRSGSSEDLMKA